MFGCEIITHCKPNRLLKIKSNRFFGCGIPLIIVGGPTWTLDRPKIDKLQSRQRIGQRTVPKTLANKLIKTFLGKWTSLPKIIFIAHVHYFCTMCKALVFIDSLKFEVQFKFNLAHLKVILMSKRDQSGQWLWNRHDPRIISRFLSEIGFYGF